ncbi:MAG: hypothetical protein ACSW8D_10940 [Prevotella sp.]|jgi:hypothetical protein
MKKTLSILFLLMLTISGMAQKKTLSATLYRQFKPSVVTLYDGRRINQPLTNVFLKNSSLLYLKGEYTMEANMDNILAVDFDDRKFVAINKQLAYLVDSVGSNALFCIELFDKETYERNLKNNINISNISLGDQISTSTVDLNTEDDYKLPVFRHFYYRLNGEYVKVHERDLAQKLPKEKRVMMKRIIALPDFSWQKDDSLMQLLKAISDKPDSKD